MFMKTVLKPVDRYWKLVLVSRKHLCSTEIYFKNVNAIATQPMFQSAGDI